MAWVVDTCVILDVARNDPQFGVSSAQFLDQKKRERLVISPVTLVELAPQFDGRMDQLRYFLHAACIYSNEPWLTEDSEAAFQGWFHYIHAKRQAPAVKRPIADILIGGFTCRFQGLITRNPDHFQPWYPRLKILNPTCKPP